MVRLKPYIVHGGGYDPRLGRDHPANRDATLEAHVVAICVARSDEPEDAYFWRCSCGRTGKFTLDVRAARNGGARHVAAMEGR